MNHIHIPLENQSSKPALTAHTAHAGEQALLDIKKRFIICCVLTVPIIILFFLPQLTTYRDGYSTILLFIFVTIVFLYGGKPFFIGLKEEIKNKQLGMMTLIGIAITVAYAYSTATIVGLRGMNFFIELVTLIDIMLLGHYLEMKAVSSSSNALEALTRLLPAIAHQVIAQNSVHRKQHQQQNYARFENDESEAQKNSVPFFTVEQTKRQNETIGESSDINSSRDQYVLDDQRSMIQEIPINQVQKGMILLVRPGEKIPADGSVIAGESEVNEAALTGESFPQHKTINDTVIAGSLNGNGSLTIEVTKDQAENYIAHVQKLVSEVMTSKSFAQDLADKAARMLTYCALAIGFGSFLVWYYTQSNLSHALERLVTVLVTACPHALGLAIPLVIVMVTSKAAQKGLLIRNRRAFEKAAFITTVVFDKTGTLTYGELEITDIIALADWSDNELLAKAASVERYAKHPIAQALLKKANELSLRLPDVHNAQTYPGKGVKATFKSGEIIIIGNQLFIEEYFRQDIAKENLDAQKQTGMTINEKIDGIDTNEQNRERQSEMLLKDASPKGIRTVLAHEKLQVYARAESLRQEGKTIIFVATISGDSELIIRGLLAASDRIRSESIDACSELRKRGIEVIMITGDTETNARAIARQLGITNVHAQVLPENKAQAVSALKQKDKVVAMVGDGINDAPALAAADVGIAIGAGTDVAVETADIILVKSNPYDVVTSIDISRASRRKIVQNIGWAVGYNVIALPLAAGLFEPMGFTLTPALGSVFMSVSTIIVAINARLFRI